MISFTEIKISIIPCIFEDKILQSGKYHLETTSLGLDSNRPQVRQISTVYLVVSSGDPLS